MVVEVGELRDCERLVDLRERPDVAVRRSEQAAVAADPHLAGDELGAGRIPHERDHVTIGVDVGADPRRITVGIGGRGTRS